jgi:hypothetical protein
MGVAYVVDVVGVPSESADFEPVAGNDPATYGLRNRCSTTELHRQVGANGYMTLLPKTRAGAELISTTAFEIADTSL